MKIKYKKIKDFKEKELQDLFLSVDWDSGNYPDKLKKRNKQFPYSLFGMGQG